MVYAYDLWALLPVKDLYDSQIMLASINAAKDMYEKGLQEMKDFKKEYGDFYSPIDKDMDWYTKNVTGRVLNVVDQLYNAGIDPLRSAEGRAAISRVINGIDTGRMARNKVSAENAQKYLQAKAVLEAAGKYDPDLEERYLRFNINNWDSAKGVWNRLSPAEAKSLKDLTTGSFDKMSARELNKADVEGFGMKYDPNARYTGITRGDIQEVANTIAPGLTGTMYADYYRDMAKRELAAEGNINPTQDQINQRLAEDITDSNLEYMKKPVADYSDWYRREGLNLQRQANAISAMRAANSGRKSSDKDNTSYGLTLLARGIQNAGGEGKQGLLNAIDFGKTVRENGGSTQQKQQMFVNRYMMSGAETTSSWRLRFSDDSSRFKDAATGGVRYVPSQDKTKLYTLDGILSNTIGFAGSPTTSFRGSIPSESSMIPTGRVYTAPTRSGNYQQFVEVKVGTADSNQTLYYKVADTENIQTFNTRSNSLNPWGGANYSDEDMIINAPEGFLTVPSLETINTFSIMDAALNKAVGLGQGPIVSGTGYLVDYVE